MLLSEKSENKKLNRRKKLNNLTRYINSLDNRPLMFILEILYTVILPINRQICTSLYNMYHLNWDDVIYLLLS